MPILYTVDDRGFLFDGIGNGVVLSQVQDVECSVVHLTPFVFPVVMPKGEEVKIWVTFASHCWTETFSQATHAGMTKFMDHKRERAFSAERFRLSLGLPDLVTGMTAHKCYYSKNNRNYMAADARVELSDGTNYWMFFVMKNQKGRWNGVRYRLQMRIESAYLTQPQVGVKSSFVNLVSKAMTM
jgi:hypothetical protein